MSCLQMAKYDSEAPPCSFVVATFQMPSNQGNFEDSDSDIEDLHHVLEESRMQLKVADKSLKKKRKDPLKTGLYLNPGKYVCYLKYSFRSILSNSFIYSNNFIILKCLVCTPSNWNTVYKNVLSWSVKTDIS